MSNNPLHVYKPLQAHSVVKPVEVEGLSYNPLTGKTEKATHRINIIQERMPTPLAGAVSSDRLIDHMRGDGYTFAGIEEGSEGACFICGADAPYELVHFAHVATVAFPGSVIPQHVVDARRTWRSCTACKTAYEIAS